VTAATEGATNTLLGGAYYARTGVTSDSSTNELMIIRELRAGEGGFSFKVSSEAFFDDRFEFLVDDTVYLTAQGDEGWAEFRTNFPAGRHTLRWRYIKDEAHAAALDAAFIDNIDLPLLEQVSFTSVPITDALLSSVSGVTVRTNSQAVIDPRFPRHLTDKFVLRIEGQTNQVYVIEGSSDLASWVPLSTNHAPFGIIEYADTNVLTQPFRYYRAVIRYETNSAGRVVPTSF
jgi:catechol 2,3-dioxygenase-like lactoylglutathione lyase family enzyme